MFENLQGFFESTAGQLVTVGVIIIFFLVILLPGKNEKGKKVDVKALTISALLIALALGLGQIKLFEMPQGGGVTAFSMLPIVLCAYLLGTRRGVMAGMAVGLLNLLFSPYVIHPLQLLVDYPFAFGALGLAGVMRNKKNGMVKGYLLGVLGRYIMAVFSGVVFFGAYAPEGFNALTWSLWYNLTYLAVEAAATVIIMAIPAVKKMFEGLKNQL